MLTTEKVEQNKKRYIELIKSITVPGANVDGFLSWLENKTDFFTAPASAKYHCDFAGGLCQHCLNVYDALVVLVNDHKFDSEGVSRYEYSEDSIKMVALLHDISKVNFYEIYMKNVNTGLKDDRGKDIWKPVPEYKVKDAEERFMLGNHEQNAEYIAHTFFPLSVEESSAILHHHAGLGWDSAQDDVPGIYNRYPLAALLHLADMVATYVYEREN